MFVVSKTCENCGLSFSDDAAFCTKCGTKARNICRRCGEELSGDARFCGSCGAPLDTKPKGAGNVAHRNTPSAKPRQTVQRSGGNEVTMYKYAAAFSATVAVICCFLWLRGHTDMLPQFLKPQQLSQSQQAFETNQQGSESQMPSESQQISQTQQPSQTVPDNVKVTFPLRQGEEYGQIIGTEVELIGGEYVKYIFRGGEYVVVTGWSDTKEGEEYPWYNVKYYDKRGEVYGQFLHRFPYAEQMQQVQQPQNVQPIAPPQMRPLVPDSVRARLPLKYKDSAYGQIRGAGAELRGNESYKYSPGENSVIRVLQGGEYVIVEYKVWQKDSNGDEWYHIRCEDGTSGHILAQSMRKFFVNILTEVPQPVIGIIVPSLSKQESNSPQANANNTNVQSDKQQNTQSAQPTADNKQGQIKGTNVNLRAAPDMKARVIYCFPGWEYVTVLSATSPKPGKYPWYMVSYGGVTGWVYGQFLKQ